MAEICGKYLSKGRQVYVEGRLQTRSWEDPQGGQKRYTTEVIASTVKFLGSTAERGAAPAAGASYGGGSAGGYGATDFGPEPSFDSNDEIPF